jgi:DNA-binding MarR family transcriptional regulator
MRNPLSVGKDHYHYYLANLYAKMKIAHQLKCGDLFSLNVFLTVATHRSFRAASIELDVTPSAVSHSIKILEQRLGVRLFNRTTRSVSLTDAGERLADKLRPAISSVPASSTNAEPARTRLADSLIRSFISLAAPALRSNDSPWGPRAVSGWWTGGGKMK